VNARIRAHLSSLYEHESGLCYFVRGAPATCKYNYPGRGVANGTICEAHSLHWDRAEVQAEVLARIALAAPGDVVEVQPPTHVNVKLIDAKPEMFGAEHTMVAGERRSPTAAQAP
jgi:hypothetical protein